MITRNQLTQQCQHIADEIERVLSEPNNDQHVFLIGIPEGFDKDNLLRYLAQIILSDNHRLAYVATTDENVVHAALNLTKGCK